MFKLPPRFAFAEWVTPEPGQWILRIDPSPSVNFSVQAKQDTQPVDLDLLFAKELGEAPEPYERLLSDARRGDARQGCSPGRTRWRRRDGSSSRCWRRPAAPSATSRGPGDPRERASSSRDTRDGATMAAGEVPPDGGGFGSTALVIDAFAGLIAGRENAQ